MISDILRQTAKDLEVRTPESVAVGMLKEAGFSDEQARIAVAQEAFEKEAVSALVSRGVDIVAASKMVKAANVNVQEILDLNQVGVDESPVSDLLNKTAEFLDTLQLENEALKKKVARLELEKQAAEERADYLAEQNPAPASEYVQKLAKAGFFNDEEIDQLKMVDPSVLQKMATMVEGPMSMGAGDGVPVDKVDPLLDFILS